ncbi:hypothetical protein EJ03DRAFT_8798 [Teratosphaeria nubilosa]|uniref:Uncharacterized protein n=1 Tax=Teratosphaeria nubilosa TaxID=161662 RepID=A0A6G1LNS0_9PEZI|nr:hypothetical protein EJ03DRAFT_8798 [Teratosphaeria nubilosa]
MRCIRPSQQLLIRYDVRSQGQGIPRSMPRSQSLLVKPHNASGIDQIEVLERCWDLPAVSEVPRCFKAFQQLKHTGTYQVIQKAGRAKLCANTYAALGDIGTYFAAWHFSHASPHVKLQCADARDWLELLDAKSQPGRLLSAIWRTRIAGR